MQLDIAFITQDFPWLRSRLFAKIGWMLPIQMGTTPAAMRIECPPKRLLGREESWEC